ncbi:MAG: hypothetical protein EBU90_17315 [Proteobacteria bacterium]|nr:hypothetical protein [Pseudomonadota bacterium]
MKVEPLNKVAITLFIIAKIFGLIGVSMGFMGSKTHTIGGYLLFFAIISIFGSIGCALFQTTKDKKKFSKEDEENARLNSFIRVKSTLEQEIKDLEERRMALENFLIKKGKML